MNSRASNLVWWMWAIPVWVALALPAVAASATGSSADSFVEGKDFTVLARPVPTADPSRIEVVEIFWYGCPHCFDFDPLVKQWASTQADDVFFQQLPSTGGAAAKVQARAFYAAQALSRLDILHRALFEAIIRDRKPMSDEPAVKALFVANGIDPALFDKAFGSPGVGAKVETAYQRAIAYQARYVPALVINGKYRVDAGEAGSFTRMLQIADYLIARERQK